MVVVAVVQKEEQSVGRPCCCHTHDGTHCTGAGWVWENLLHIAGGRRNSSRDGYGGGGDDASLEVVRRRD